MNYYSGMVSVSDEGNTGMSIDQAILLVLIWGYAMGWLSARWWYRVGLFDA